MAKEPIPPKSEWVKMDVAQLYEVRGRMMDYYYGLRQANASFANQYQGFINELDVLLARREHEASLEQEDRD